jgi:hypothetical protein
MKVSSCVAFAVGGCAAISLLLALSGCNSQQPDTTPLPNCQTGYAVWMSQAPKKDEFIPGIDFGAIDWGNWNDKLLFAVWVDRKDVGMNNGRGVVPQKTGPGRAEATYTVTCSPPDVKVECYSTDGTSGSVTVNGQRHDVSQGRLFLVSIAGGEVRVKQLSRDGLSAPNGPADNPPECFVKLKDDPEVRTFFGKGAGKSK